VFLRGLERPAEQGPLHHQLHGATAMIGIPSLCLAAVLVNMALVRNTGIDAPPQWTAHLPWISFALMIGALALFFSALESAGVDMSALWVSLAALSVLRAKT